jgi:hypothetical protein
MATNPSFRYLALDGNYDTIWDGSQSLSGAEAVAQAVKTRLNLFMGQWWEDYTIGLPVTQSILGQLASQSGIKNIENIIGAYILNTPYVTALNNISVSFSNGQLSYSAGFLTSFGPASVSGGAS